MRILITGNQGYVGTVMAKMMSEAGHEVVGLDTGYFTECWMGTDRLDYVFRQIVKDIRDVDAADFTGVDAVAHLAGLSNDPTGELNPGLTEAINLAATIRVAGLAKQAGASRFVFASSCSIYGSGASDALTEEDAFNPLTAYARSKVESEFALQKLADDRFSPVFMRNATVYGFSPRLRFDLVVNNLTGWAVSTHQVKLLSDGRAWRPLLHVDDMSQAFLRAIEAPREAIHNQAFNVGNEEDNWQIRDIAKKVAEIVPDCAVTFAAGAGADTRNYNVSFAKIRERLPAFKPQWNVPKGIEQLYREFARIELAEPEFSSRTYTRLKQIQYLIDSGQVSSELRWVGAPAAV